MFALKLTKVITMNICQGFDIILLAVTWESAIR